MSSLIDAAQRELGMFDAELTDMCARTGHAAHALRRYILDLDERVRELETKVIFEPLQYDAKEIQAEMDRRIVVRLEKKIKELHGAGGLEERVALAALIAVWKEPE